MSRPVILLLLVLPALEAWQAAGPDNKTSHSKADDSFLTGPAFTFDQVLRLVGQSVIPLVRRKLAIQKRGLDFAVTQEQLDQLKSAGATEDFLKLVKKKAKTDPSVPPTSTKQDPQGAVAIACGPAECEISVNGTAVGATEDGKLEVEKLRPGKWTIDLKKDGYIGQQSVVEVNAGATVPLSVTLEPGRAMQEALGAELFEKVVEALGGKDALKELASVQATGSTTIGAPNGKSVRWTLLMRNRPERALFQIRGGGKLWHEIAFEGREFRTSKNLKGQDALDLPTEFGLIRDNQLVALITRLLSPQFKMLANRKEPVDGEEYALFAEDGVDKLAIGLDEELRPQRVRITTAAGAGSAVITYSDYYKDGKGVYPKTMEIKPDGWTQGIDVRFDSVDLSPKLDDKDYKLRGKVLPDLAR